MSRILLVDDDSFSLNSTKKILEFEGHEVISARDGAEALAIAQEIRGTDRSCDAILTDVRMPRLDGIEFLKAVKCLGDETPFILMTAYGRVEDAVWAMKFGAVDFLTKPFKRQALQTALKSALERGKIRRLESGKPSPDFIGVSAASRKLEMEVERVAATDVSVLITGESGSGKERIARRIHDRSARREKRFIAINCAALPESLMESELFGHEKGAFTGANQRKIGLFEAADQGTLLLDEIGDLPLTLQPKLLRVLQEGEIRRVGSHESRKINVRVLAATHQDLRSAVQAGRFREDLLFRLEVVPIEAPPLRTRPEDVPELAYAFLKEAKIRHRKPDIQGISEPALECLLAHDWPGNVRELLNVIERAIVFAQNPLIEVMDLPEHLRHAADAASGSRPAPHVSIPLGTSLKDVEDLLIRKTLELTDGDKNMTAKLLGIHARTIYRRLGEGGQD